MLIYCFVIHLETYTLRKLKHVVIDEADTLFDDTFSFDVLDLLNNINVSTNCE